MTGPNQESLAKELQTLVGVDNWTFQHMLQTAKQENDEKNDDAKDESEGEKDMDDDYDDHDDDDDDLDDESEDEDEDDNDEEKDKSKGREDCDTKDNPALTVGSADYKLKSQELSKGHGKNEKNTRECEKYKGLLNGDNSGWGQVSEPVGIGLPMEDFLNGNARKNEPCSDQTKPRVPCKKRKFKRKRKHKNGLQRVLFKFLKRFLEKKTTEFEPNLMHKIKDLLADRLRSSSDGLVHVFPKKNKAAYTEALDALTNNFNDKTFQSFQGRSPNLGGRLGDPALHGFTMDDTTLNGPVFRVSPAKAGEQVRAKQPNLSTNQLSTLTNQFHPLANDEDNKVDATLQSDILHEELGTSICLSLILSLALSMVYIHTYIHTHTHTHTHTNTHTCTHTYMHTYKHIYIHTYIRTHIHTYIHTYTHTQMIHTYIHIHK